MPAITTRGAASAKGFGFTNGGGPVTYIEEVFSTYLYTGNASTQTITNGIDLSTKGGMVWSKSRSNATNHVLRDTVRGNLSGLNSNQTSAQTISSVGYDLTSFNSTGFSLGPDFQEAQNTSGSTYASWTFRKQPKFFDVVTYTGNGSNRTIAHNLGSVPSCMLVKRTDTAESWIVYHRSLTSNYYYLVLNSTAGEATDLAVWNGTTPTSSVFSVGTNVNVNASGGTYVAYLFAHDAGGFGLTGADNVISCGSFTGNTTVTLGYEPQWVLIKNYAGANSWTIIDNMRGMENPGNNNALLRPNTGGAEGVGQGIFPIATGFTTTGYSGLSCIYIAIRRGPMKVPTVGTSVFAPFASSGATGTQLTTNFPVDSGWFDFRGGDTNNASVLDRLRRVPSTSTDTAANIFLTTSATAAETTTSVNGYEWWNTGIRIGPYYATYSTVYWLFGRAPGFFDEVCYTGTGSVRTISHNLTVAPELMISKTRGTLNPWQVWTSYFSYLSGTAPSDNCTAVLNSSNAFNGYSESSSISALPTASVFSLGTQAVWNGSGNTAVMYLFASCPGVSKVGSYTGNGSSQTIACGFTAGARFVLIKRTDSTGDWYVWDSVRGIVAGNDPHLSLNTTAAEVTTDDSVDTDNSGFIVNQLAATNINVTSATYIFLAIA